jgi:hypothetical protein
VTKVIIDIDENATTTAKGPWSASVIWKNAGVLPVILEVRSVLRKG